MFCIIWRAYRRRGVVSFSFRFVSPGVVSCRVVVSKIWVVSCVKYGIISVNPGVKGLALPHGARVRPAKSRYRHRHCASSGVWLRPQAGVLVS